MPHRVVATLTYASPLRRQWAIRTGQQVGAALALGDWTVGSVIAVQSGIPFVISMANSGSITSPRGQSSRPVDAGSAKPLQHWYNGKTTTVTLPLRKDRHPRKRILFLKYNSCAFTGEDV